VSDGDTFVAWACLAALDSAGPVETSCRKMVV